MSAIFETLKKLDQKEKPTAFVVPQAPNISGTTVPTSKSPKWIVFWVLTLSVSFIGSVALGYWKYSELREVISSQQYAFTERLDLLAGRIAEIGHRIESLETNDQKVLKRLDRFSDDLVNERSLRSQALAEQAVRIDEDRISFQKKLDEQFNSLSQRVDVLETPSKK